MDYAAAFRARADDVERLLAELTQEQFAWRSTPDTWSIGDCILHLIATADAYLPRLRAATAKTRARGWYGTPPFRLGWLGGWIARQLEPPPTWRLPAPANFRPADPLPIGEARDAYLARNGALTQLVHDAHGLDLERVKISSPVSRLIRFNLAAAFTIVAAHERRHLWQARRVSEAPGFPAAR